VTQCFLVSDPDLSKDGPVVPEMRADGVVIWRLAARDSLTKANSHLQKAAKLVAFFDP
jgi:hypothetical protein